MTNNERDIRIYLWPDGKWRPVDGEGVTEERRIYLPAGLRAEGGEIVDVDGAVHTAILTEESDIRIVSPSGERSSSLHVSDIRRR